MQKVSTTKAPAAIGPYTQAMICNKTVYTSGQIPLNPADGSIVSGGIAEQTKQAIANLTEVLKEAGSSMAAIVKTTCFLANMQDFAVFNEIYADYFVSSPARSCIAAKDLPKGVLVEIEAIAEIL